ncbi:MAG: hypothetical protein Q8P72_00735 [Candidatus Roizmanbacteria bacterium]|nr:hypothetical protein [Candidatus Roizmanbacteria bacterium]
MSRLYKHRYKQSNKKILLLVLLVICMIGVILFVGFDSLINSALFFTNISKEKTIQDTSSSEDDFYGSIFLDTPIIATNSATIVVSGRVSSFDTVAYFLNNVKTDVTKLDGETNFNEKIDNLKVGENSLYAVGQTKNGKNSKKSEVFTVIYKRDAPVLEIETPHDGDTVKKQDLQIVGKTDNNTTVHLNNSPVVVDLQGEFVTSIRLKEGSNTLEFSAVDIAGNSTNSTITVTYERDE